MNLLSDGKPAARFIRRESIPNLSEKRDDIGKTWLIDQVNEEGQQAILVTGIIPNTGNYQISGLAFKDGFWYNVTIVVKDGDKSASDGQQSDKCSILFVPRQTPFLEGNILNYYEDQIAKMASEVN